MPGNLTETKAVESHHQLQAFPGGLSAEMLTGAVTLDDSYGNIIKFDANGAHRNVTLPSVIGREGVVLEVINHSSGAHNVVLKNAAGDTIATVNQNEAGKVAVVDGAWVLIGIYGCAPS